MCTLFGSLRVYPGNARLACTNMHQKSARFDGVLFVAVGWMKVNKMMSNLTLLFATFLFEVLKDTSRVKHAREHHSSPQDVHRIVEHCLKWISFNVCACVCVCFFTGYKPPEEEEDKEDKDKEIKENN